MKHQANELRLASTKLAGGVPATGRASRITDVLIASLALMVLSPLMLIVVVAIMVEIGWPVIYSQTRTGQGGRPFRIYKFRKFHVRNDAPGPLLTLRNDSRMSRIGRLLERSKIDELPQFWNVLIGDMAIVGPRPQNQISEGCFTAEYQSLLDCKPGIFGPGQVAFRNEGALYPAGVDRHEFYREKIFPLKARLDLAYYPHRTWLSDMGWIVRGILAVFRVHPFIRELAEAAPGGMVPAAETRSGSHAHRLGVIVPGRDLFEPSASGGGTI